MFTFPLNLQLQPRLEFRFAVALLPSCGVIRYYRKSPNLSNYREDWLNPRHRSSTPPPPPIFSSCFFFFVHPSQDGSEVKQGKNVRIHAIGSKRFLQISKCLVSDSGMYTCDAGQVATSGTVEVYGKSPQPTGWSTVTSVGGFGGLKLGAQSASIQNMTLATFGVQGPQ